MPNDPAVQQQWRIEVADGEQPDPRDWSYVWETSDVLSAQDCLNQVRASKRAVDNGLVFRALRLDTTVSEESW